MKVLIFCALFEFATALNKSEIIQPGKSIVAFENFGTLNEEVKVAFAKLTLDSSLVISTMEEIESELSVLQKADLNHFQKGTIERMSQSMELKKELEERMKRNLNTVEVKENPAQDEDFVIEVFYDFRPKSYQTEGYQDELPTEIDVSIFKIVMKMMDESSAVSDVNSVLDSQLFNPLNDLARKQYEDAIKKIKERYDELILHEVTFRETIITKFENGVIEAYVPFHMVKPEEEVKLFRFLTNIPLVFQNKIFIQIEATSILGIRKNADTTTYFLFEKDNISNCMIPKRWFEKQRYLCRQGFDHQETSEIVGTCEGALYLESHENIKKTCSTKFTKPSNLAVFLNQDKKYLIFTPPYEDVLLDCDGEKSPLQIRLENLQIISDSGSCTLVEQKWKLFSSYLHFREGIAIGRDYSRNEEEIREIENSEIESIWPELGSAQFRENIIKEKSNVTNTVIYKRDEL